MEPRPPQPHYVSVLVIAKARSIMFQSVPPIVQKRLPQ